MIWIKRYYFWEIRLLKKDIKKDDAALRKLILRDTKVQTQKVSDKEKINGITSWEDLGSKVTRTPPTK